MKLCRFLNEQQEPAIGLMTKEDQVLDLSASGISSLTLLLDSRTAREDLEALSRENLPAQSLTETRLLSPVEKQEVWAAGVTYHRSKKARMEESNFNANAYDRVYEAARPELFFKSLPEKVVGPGHPIGVRQDARWSVPEPELALVMNSRGEWVGCTIGNDVSSRDIEGENLLYLPQAKVYDRSCAIGPAILLGTTESEARHWTIGLRIQRDDQCVFDGETSVDQIKRSFAELVGYLCRSQSFPHGAILLTGTGVVPSDEFSLLPNDIVTITISGIGQLQNPVQAV